MSETTTESTTESTTGIRSQALACRDAAQAVAALSTDAKNALLRAMGDALEAEFERLQQNLPVGMSLQKVSDQPAAVSGWRPHTILCALCGVEPNHDG